MTDRFSHRLIAAGAVLLLTLSAPTLSASTSSRVHAAAQAHPRRPVLAFYYTWYHPATFCTCSMSDMPVKPYDSSDDATINRQITEAAGAGITAFITSWPGPGNTQDENMVKILADAVAFRKRTGTPFFSSLYLESDSLGTNLRGPMQYVIQHYTKSPAFFRWHHKPVIFIWHPIGNGRTLATWATLRRQVDPNHHLIWSAEGTDTNLLSVFDGLHLFSAAYWGLKDGTIRSIDAGFRAKINAYAAAHRTTKIWAAGVEPGYDDTRVPGRTGTYRVPRNAGATYRQSWSAAIASNPDWITITTYNEWFEGAMIEPSRHYGSQYLQITRYYSWLWRRTL